MWQVRRILTIFSPQNLKMSFNNVIRQGVLPWTNFWTSTRPFGTPIGPYAVKWGLTIIMILAPPAGDAFNFGTDFTVPNIPESQYFLIFHPNTTQPRH
jgi:hypothetical protein